MNDWLDRQLAAWITDGGLTDEVMAFARLVGRDFHDWSLPAAVKQSQMWMQEVRPVGTPRWQMPATATTDMEEFKRIIMKLDLTLPRIPVSRRADAVVILGATYGAMRDRLAYADSYLIRADQLIVAASLRKLTGPKPNAVEIADLKACGFNPEGRTEADAARFLLENVSQDISANVLVIDTPDQPDGKPAATEQTIHSVAAALERGTNTYFVLHQPYARQVWTVLRALAESGHGDHLRSDFVIGPMSKPLDELLSVIVDETWRMLYEIARYLGHDV